MATHTSILVLLISVAFFASQCESARILGLFTAPSKSHMLIHTAIADALVEQGHDVTVVTTSPILKKKIKYRHIKLDVPGFLGDSIGELISNKEPMWKKANQMISVVTDCANASLHHPAMKQLMATESFDLVILGYFFNEFQLGVAAHFKCPVIVSFMNRPVAFVNNFVGNPKEMASVPNTIISAVQPMNFMTRVKNFVVSLMVDDIVAPLVFTRSQRKLYDANFPSDKYPSFDEMMKNVSLVFANGHFSQGPIRSNVPAMVEIGGIQIKEKTDPLPEDLKTLLDNAKNGVVYFSFGSNVQGKFLGTNAKLMFNVLSKLKQTVLWKWDEPELPGQSPNIIYKSWLPQDDILAHPNVKLFITHAGGGSVVESQYHGVPMVAIPLFADQFTNAVGMETAGFGVQVNYATLSTKTFENGVIEVLENPIYRNNVQRFSKLYKDRPMTAKQTVVYWTEYVLRHHGAPHMQSPAVHMNFFQLTSLDVIGFLIAVIYVVYKVTKVCILFIWSKLCSKLCSKKNKNLKNKNE